MDAELQELLDKQAIHEVILRCARGLDRRDREMVLECFHEDAFLHYNTYKGNARAFWDGMFGAPGTLFENQEGKATVSQGHHVITNNLIEVKGDIGYSEAYVQGIRAGTGSVQQGAEDRQTGPGFPIERVARYIDRLERRDGTWRIANRQVAMTWLPEEMDVLPNSWRNFTGAGGYKTENFAPSRLDRTDPSYDRDWS